jgi:REP element-mobilizing transposase RayT
MGTRHHRLNGGAYRGRVSATFTLCVAERKRLFVTAPVVEVFVSFLQKVVEKRDFRAIYCFMPDHLHLIASANSDNSDVLRAVKHFKQVTGYWLKQNLPLFKWQSSFYDRIIRARELGSHVQYVLDNPVRRGLVREWRDYRFIGAIGMDLETFLRDMAPD